MELRQLTYFLEVARQEHVTEAAYRLHVAQSAVSRHISLLEDELGVQLFTRKGRNIKLTNIGKTFAKYAERAIHEIEAGRQEVADFLNPEKGLIKLGFTTGLTISTLPAMLGDFRKEYPDIRFQLHQGTVSYLLRLIEKGEIDLALAAPVPAGLNGINTEIFYSERFVALLPKNHRLNEMGQLRLNQLKREQLVSFRSGLPLHDLVKEACIKAGFSPVFAFEGEDTETIKGLVAAGMGCALLPEHSIKSKEHPDILVKPVTEPEITRSVGLILSNTRHLGPAEQLFYEYIKNFYARLFGFRN